MIKRYTPSGTGMVECYSGDYVHYDDHQEIMESIGAGGVSGRITKKTIEQHRSEFDQWAAREGLRMTRRSDGQYVAPFTLIAWRAWQAAKGENNAI